MTQNRILKSLALAVLALLATAGGAAAHPGHLGANSFMDGFAHPISGYDHVIAMVAVGLWAARLGGCAVWAVPSTFVAVMSAGFTWAIFGGPLGFVEAMITLSVAVLSLAVLLRWKLPLAGAMTVVGYFALFHGYAHGSELPVEASSLYFAEGFALATALLHGAGLAAGLLWQRGVTRELQ